MSRHVNCPTCGTKLAPGHTSPSARTCTSCHRSNPAGFDYCGFCASPMENTALRAKMSELAKPPGGWPNLTAELVEMRFYLQQGLLDDAYELLSILQRRHPGHPALEELVRRPKPSRRVDTDVLKMVDRVLAESANLVARVPRRAAPKWQAPSSPGPERTQVHTAVPVEDGDAGAKTTAPRKPNGPTRSAPAAAGDDAASTRTRPAAPRGATTSAPAVPRTTRPAELAAAAPAHPSTGSQATRVRPTNATRSASEEGVTAPRPAAPSSDPIAASRAARASTGPRPSNGSAAPTTGPRPTTTASGSGPHVPPIVVPTSAGAREKTQVYGPNDPTPASAPQTGHTIVVDALQPASPFSEAERTAAGERTRGRRRREPVRPAEPAAPVEPEPVAAESAPEPEPRKRRVAFGEHVLNRLR